MKKLVMIILMGSWAALAQEQIVSIFPNEADPGTNLTVTFTLPNTTPPTPPVDVAADSVALGSISGASVSRSSLETLTAVFTIPADHPGGALDAVVAFTTPQGTLEFTLAGGFTVRGGEAVEPGSVITNAQPTAAGYPIVDTGQTQFYGASSAIVAPTNGAAFHGQDGQYVGRQPSYTVSGDGVTVLDHVTGLTWTQSHDWSGDGVLDVADKMTQAAAAAYVATLNAANYGGYSDWRLPTIKELYSLMNFNGTDPDVSAETAADLTPFIDDSVFEIGYGDVDAGERIIDSQFAVSTIYVDTVMGGEQAMFGLNLVDGRIKGYPTLTGKTYYAYYCRGNTAYGVNDFEDLGDGTVSDVATGLMWAQADSGVGLDWEAALAYAETNTLAGYSDWRLPNAKELQSLVDYSRSPGTTSSAAIDPLFSATAIVNMAGEVDYPWYWSGTTHLKFTGSAASGVYVCFGRGTGTMDSGATIIDVHGAGCQRSDPKSGDPANYPNAGNGPQGDVQRVYNHARLVRDILPPADTDGDGMSDEDESFVGSDPEDADSVFKLAVDGDANGATLSWPMFRGGLRYRLMACTNLVEGGWYSLGSTTSSNLVDGAGNDATYYRVDVTENN